MKKIFLSTIGLIIFSIGLLNAQTNQGKFLLGLSSDIFDLGYTTSKEKSDTDGTEEATKNFNVNFGPKMGYFVIDNLVIGIDLGVGLQTSISGNDNKYIYTSSSVGPFVRYYVPTSKVLPFIELGGSIGSFSTRLGDSKDKTGILEYRGGIGLAAALSDRVMVDVLAGYHSITYKDKEDNQNNERWILGTLGLNIGFTILLGSN